MNENVQFVLGGIVMAFLALRALAKRYPDVAWLQAVRSAFPEPSEAEQAKMRRRANVHAGVELILIGIVLPLGYFALTVMFFSAVTTLGISLVSASSLLCIGLGVTAIWQNRR